MRHERIPNANARLYVRYTSTPIPCLHDRSKALDLVNELSLSVHDLVGLIHLAERFDRLFTGERL